MVLISEVPLQNKKCLSSRRRARRPDRSYIYIYIYINYTNLYHVYVYIYIFVYIYIYVYIYICICICISMYVCMYIYMYISIYCTFHNTRHCSCGILPTAGIIPMASPPEERWSSSSVLMRLPVLCKSPA